MATVTALVPLALADVAAALTANMRMIRRIAEIYGGRAGAFGGWRLLRTVLAHLVATGALAVGDDLIETVAERVAVVALGFPGVREARITVNKPDAPIEYPFENVSVTVVR